MCCMLRSDKQGCGRTWGSCKCTYPCFSVNGLGSGPPLCSILGGYVIFLILVFWSWALRELLHSLQLSGWAIFSWSPFSLGSTFFFIFCDPYYFLTPGPSVTSSIMWCWRSMGWWSSQTSTWKSLPENKQMVFIWGIWIEDPNVLVL